MLEYTRHTEGIIKLHIREWQIFFTKLQEKSDMSEFASLHEECPELPEWKGGFCLQWNLRFLEYWHSR